MKILVKLTASPLLPSALPLDAVSSYFPPPLPVVPALGPGAVLLISCVRLRIAGILRAGSARSFPAREELLPASGVLFELRSALQLLFFPADSSCTLLIIPQASITAASGVVVGRVAVSFVLRAEIFFVFNLRNLDSTSGQ